MKKTILLVTLLATFLSQGQTKIYNQPVKYKVTPNLSVVDSILTKASNDLLSATSFNDFKTQLSLGDYIQTLSFANGGLTISGANTVDLDTRYYSESEVDNLLSQKLSLTGGVITGDLSANNFIGNGDQLTGVAKIDVDNNFTSNQTINVGDANNLFRIRSNSSYNQGISFFRAGGQESSLTQVLNKLYYSVNPASNSDADIISSAKWSLDSNGNTDQDGGGTFGGSLSASSFIGNGSQLTDVDADFLGGINSSQYARIDAANDFTEIQTLDKTIAEIDAASNKALVTKEWVENNAGLPVAFYAEGTFTPVLIDQAGLGTYSYNIDVAKYVRIGNSVTFSILFKDVNTSGIPTGFLRITGMPFDFSHISEQAYNFNCQVFGGNVSFDSIQGAESAGALSSSIDFKITQVGGGTSNRFAYQAVSFTGNGIVGVSGTYITNVYTP